MAAETTRLAAALLCIAAVHAGAQTADSARNSGAGRNGSHEAAPAIRAARITAPIEIDGRLDEEAWRAAIPFTEFRQLDPNEGQPASERTEARVVVDDDALYVGLRLFDSDVGRIQAQLARRDESIEGDIAEVYLDTYHDHLTGFVFRLSPLGARRDASISADGGQDGSWDPVWIGAASIDSEGWSAEFRIPLSQLRYDPGAADHTWGLQVARKIARKGEVVFLALTPKTEQQGVNRYGHLTGLGRLPAPRRVELVPYALARNNNPTAAPDDPFRGRNELAPGAGLDVKYGITSNLTLDATFNPDFGQVEVDPAVVNLSAFETFFPEKRPFFIEGGSIFRFGSMRTMNASNGYDFVHTRRIGRAPQRFIGGSGVSFVDSPNETTIAGAAKLTGRTKGGWSVGLLNAVTLREEARFRTATSLDTTATVEPGANYFMGRVKRDLRGGNTVLGVALNTVHRQLDDAALEPMFRTSSYAGGFDWNHAWHNRRWAFDGSVVMTYNTGSAESIDALQTSPARYYQRPDKQRYRRDPTRTSLSGYVAELTFAKLSGEHWRGTLTYQDYNPGFDVNEAGFLGSTDMRGISPLIAYYETKPSRRLRWREHYLFWNPTWNYDGDLTFNGVGHITVFQTPNFWTTFFRLDWRPPRIDDRLTRGGPLGLTPTVYQALVEVSTDSRKKHRVSGFAYYWTRRDGAWTATASLGPTIRPSSAVRLQFSPEYSRNYSTSQYVTSQTDPAVTDTYGARYVFATLDQHQFGMTTRLDWTFTPEISLQLFAQPLLSVGDFKDYKEFATPRRLDFEVYGRDIGTISRDQSGTYTVDPDGAGPSSAFTFGDRDFNSRFLRGNAVLRWEYRPGSALFLVWQQSRSGFAPTGVFDFGRDFGELWATPPVNVFVLKATYWIGR